MVTAPKISSAGTAETKPLTVVLETDNIQDRFTEIALAAFEKHNTSAEKVWDDYCYTLRQVELPPNASLKDINAKLAKVSSSILDKRTTDDEKEELVLLEGLLGDAITTKTLLLKV